MDRGIVVLDFGGQYAHLIANRIRHLNVYAEIRPPTVVASDVDGAAGLVLSGGPSSVYAKDRPDYNPALLSLGLPMMGLCYGHQLLAWHLGGEVVMGETMEFGAAELRICCATGVLAGLGERERIWMSHRDSVVGLPPGFSLLGQTDDCPIAAMGDDLRRIYGLQFHPEVTHTQSGMQILRNFLALCNCSQTWTMEQYIEAEIGRIQDQTAGRKVFLLVSGGVDSSVSFMLLNRALGKDRVLGLHIDNGFMRKNETLSVDRFMRESGFDNLHVVDASEEFLAAVKGVVDPEKKRQIIGEEFVAVRERSLAALRLDPEEWLLGQGTLYTDTIESGGTENSVVIKTHHNRVSVIEELLAAGRVVEPLNQLYKDEVRQLGEKLGLPAHLVWRHPFPGPGLAVRVLCSDGKAATTDVVQLQERVGAVAKEFGFEAEVLPLRSVGVQGDTRTYGRPVVLVGDMNWSALEAASTELTNEIASINRVIFLLAPIPRPPQSPKQGFLTRARLDLLREADAVAMAELERYDLMSVVNQMPTVLLPLSSDGRSESIVLRPISTDNYMTANFSRLPRNFLTDVARRVLQIAAVEVVFFDVTHKPPGTVEWE